MQAQRVDFIAVPTTDRERAAEFYEHTLGFVRNPNSTDCNGAAFKVPDGNELLLHHRYAPYRDGSTP